MKHVILLLLFAVVPHLLPAQNWAPINTTDIYNYKADTASAISHSLWIDSVGFDGVDSVYYPNRIVKHITNNLALKNQPQFLNTQVILQTNGLYLFTAPTIISYYSLATVNDTYTYDSTNSVTATVLSIDEATVLGSLDSLKTILLSSGDTLIASKNHGFVQYPMEYGSGKYYRLVGIEGDRNLGEHVAKFEDFFNYAVGDSFWYYTDFWSMACAENPWQCPTTATRYVVVIDTIITNGDTTILSKNIEYPYPISGTAFIVNTEKSDANLYPNTLMKDTSCYSSTYPCNIGKEHLYNLPYLEVTENSLSYNNGQGPVENWYSGCTSFKNSVGKTIKLINRHYTQNYNKGDTLNYIIASYGYQQFIEGLGKTRMSANGFESGASSILCAYRLAGDSAITILDNYLFTVGIEEPTSPTNFHLLGNPVTTTLSIQLATQQPHTLTLYSLSGQQLLQQQTQETTVTMDVSHLSQGVYLLEVRNQSGVNRQRVVKM